MCTDPSESFEEVDLALCTFLIGIREELREFSTCKMSVRKARSHICKVTSHAAMVPTCARAEFRSVLMCDMQLTNVLKQLNSIPMPL